MTSVVWAFVDQIGRWKPIEEGKFRIINRGRHKGKFLVKYLVRRGVWRRAIVDTIRVPQ